MRKFFILVKKEVQELLTLQMLAPLIAVVLIFLFIGNVVGKQVNKPQGALPVEVADQDGSAASRNFIAILAQSGLDPKVQQGISAEAAISEAEAAGEKAALVIPPGFGKGISAYLPQKIGFYYVLNNFSATGNSANAAITAALARANAAIGAQLIKQAAPSVNPASISGIAVPDSYIIVGGKRANASFQAVSGFVSSQTYFIPIILMLVIVVASQLIAVSIASEKENKTLETLLSSPVSRRQVVAAKLLGAAIVALISAGIYMFGLSRYIGGISGGQAASKAAGSAVAQLGLSFGLGDYALLGLSLFFGILVALALAIILGSFAQDAKSAQGAVAPLTVLVLIPYLLTILLDISSLSPAARWAVYAIPFAHPFLASSDIMLGKPQYVWYGIAYMAAVFLIFVYVASRIFASEKIFSMKVNFGRFARRRR